MLISKPHYYQIGIVDNEELEYVSDSCSEEIPINKSRSRVVRVPLENKPKTESKNCEYTTTAIMVINL